MDGHDDIYSVPAVVVADGPWSGWSQFPGGDPFEDLTGPFYYRNEAAGPVCGFAPEARHANGGGTVHGGALMTFADFALFIIGRDGLGGAGVTVAFACEFVGAVRPGQRVECRGEVVRAGRSLVFVRALARTDGEPVLSFSATLKKAGRRSS